MIHTKIELKALASRVLLGILASVWLAPAFPQSPRDDLWNEDLLAAVVSEVSKLDHDQLEIFIEYLAICGVAIDSKEQQFACERTKITLEIKAADAHSLQKLVRSVSISNRLVRLGWERSSGEERTRLAKQIERQVDIDRALRATASDRYARLKGQSRRQ